MFALLWNIIRIWPGERDSNPRRCYPQRFSRPPLSTTQPSPVKLIEYNVEATPRFELGNQGFAGPCLTAWLCRLKWCPEPDLNRHERSVRGILSPLCLPFHHPGKDYFNVLKWSGRRGSNPRPQPWQGYALPLSYSRKNKLGIITMLFLKIKELIGIL